MNVAVCRITLHLPENHSLKGKRQVVRSLTSRVRQRFNVSIAEIEETDRWQVTVLGLSCVSGSVTYATEVLSQALRFIEGQVLGEAEVVGCETDVLAGLS